MGEKETEPFQFTCNGLLKVEHHLGELFPRVGFIVTNLQLLNRAVMRFYDKRGTAEQWIKEGKKAAH